MLLSHGVEKMLLALTRGRIRFHGPAGNAVQPSEHRGAFYKPQFHRFAELIFGLSGRLEVFVNDRWLDVQPGTVRVFLPGAIHTERYARKAIPYELLWVTLASNGMGFHITAHDPGHGYHLAGKRLALHLADREALTQSSLEPAVATDRWRQIRFQALLMSALVQARGYMDNLADHDARIPFHYPAVEQVRQYLDDHFSSPILLRDLAAMVHYSPCHLNVLFRGQVGVPIGQYVLERRLARAESLLRTTNLEIKQIAYGVGFRDPLYFSRVFHRHHGLSPSQYRRP